MQTQKSKAVTRRRSAKAENQTAPVAPVVEAAPIVVVELTEAKVEKVAAPKVKEPKPLPTPDEALVKAKAENPTRFAHVLAVTEQTVKGDPKRVVIQCQRPETKMVAGSPVSVCEGTREIAIQDLFQVDRCAACADRAVRKARRNRAKTRAKADRAMLKQMRQGR